MNRVFLESIEGSRAELGREERHHLVAVLRTKPGEIFEGIIGEDFRYRCRLAKDGNGYYGEIIEKTGLRDESPLQLDLAAALIKRDRFELVIQKATELGVRRIIPLFTARTEIHLDHKREEKKLERWKRIIAESVKQSGRNRSPRLEHPLELGQYLAGPGDHPVLVMDEAGDLSIRGALQQLQGEAGLTVMIGPEGGWAEEDRLFMKRCPTLLRAGIGPRILRAETAAVSTLAIVQYELGDLGILSSLD